jgi:hypothetical protein
MAAFREGKVVELIQNSADLVRARVALSGRLPEEIEAIGFPAMLGAVTAGDQVVVNTTGIELSLGTGGAGFILWNLDGAPPARGQGHILKMRYTPWQTEVLAAEAPESPHHHRLADVESIEGMPVVACGLHSQVAGVAAGVKAAAPEARIGYLMTDGGALPLAVSELVRSLKSVGLVDATCTCGHAFGGDLEAVNVHSGLAALRVVGTADVAVVALGPGIVGTGTRLGYSGIEQGTVLDAAAALGGLPVACLRVSFADDRPRHHGVSHHSLTALHVAAREPATVVLPTLPPEQLRALRGRLDEAGISERHEVVVADGAPGVELLRERGLDPSSMGRPMSAAPEPFLAASAAGARAAELLRRG